MRRMVVTCARAAAIQQTGCKIKKMESFQVDVILKSLRELQKEKSQNERLLAGEYAKRKKIEEELDATNTKLTTTSAKHDKMKETLQIAELKVAQTQAQAKMLEQLNCEKRDRIAQLNEQVAHKNKERESHMKRYETEMNTLTEKFRTTWHTQSEDIMDLKLAQCQKEIDEYTAIIATNKLQLKELSDQFENIATEYSKSHTPKALGEITESTWALVRALFSAEHEVTLEVFREKQLKDQEHIQRLTQEHAELTKKLEDIQSSKQHNEE